MTGQHVVQRRRWVVMERETVVTLLQDAMRCDADDADDDDKWQVDGGSGCCTDVTGGG
jgi:hypothetical protein